MKCKKAEKLILNFVDLCPKKKEGLEEHLKSCPWCNKLLDFQQKTHNLIKEHSSFVAPENFWENYWSSLKEKLAFPQSKSLIANKAETLFSFLKTPLIGPVPAYVFTFLIILFLGVGLYPNIGKKNLSERFTNSLVISQGSYVALWDEGSSTIYKLRR